MFSLFRWSREGQRPAVPVLQQRGRDQLPADALRAVCSPKAHHGAASGGGQGCDGQPGPHRPGKDVCGGGCRDGGAGQETPLLLLLLLFQIYRLEDSCCLFTLQGHSGGITAIYIDQVSFLFRNNGAGK